MCAVKCDPEKVVSIQKEWPFCALQSCGWDPTLGDAVDFCLLPTEIPKPKKTDQLPAPLCQMLSYFSYCHGGVHLKNWVILRTCGVISNFGENDKQAFFLGRAQIIVWFVLAILCICHLGSVFVLSISVLKCLHADYNDVLCVCVVALSQMGYKSFSDIKSSP